MFKCNYFSKSDKKKYNLTLHCQPLIVNDIVSNNYFLSSGTIQFSNKFNNQILQLKFKKQMYLH